MKHVLLTFSALLAVRLSAAVNVTVDSVRQNWPWDTRVEVVYTVSGGFCDVTPSVGSGGSAVGIPPDATLPLTMTGSAHGVGPGTHTLVFDAANLAFPDNVKTPALWKGAAVGLAAKETPFAKYLVLDLTQKPFAVSWLGSVPAGGWTDLHKTEKLVFARVPVNGGTTFYQGAAAGEIGYVAKYEERQSTLLTNDFYVSVFEVTQKQWELVKGSLPSGIDAKNSGDSKPVSNISYLDLVGEPQDANDYGWPYTSKVTDDSLVGILRANTVLPECFSAGWKIYLPTDAQWEFACRGGSAATWPNGADFVLKSDPSKTGYAAHHDDSLDRYAVHRYNSGNSAAVVGSRLPNAFGIHDMLGNVSEWTICYALSSPCPGGTEPLGNQAYAAASAKLRSLRGGNYASFMFSGSTYTGYRSVNASLDAASEDYGIITQRPAFHVRYSWGEKHDFIGARLCIAYTSVPE